MDVRGYTWIYMDIHGCTWIYMDIHGYSFEKKKKNVMSTARGVPKRSPI